LEKPKYIIPNIKKSKMLGLAYDTYNLLIYDKSVVFAKVPLKIVNEEVNKARLKAKAEGKGYLVQIKEQMNASSNFYMRYTNIDKNDILKEDLANFEANKTTISKINANYKTYYDSNNISNSKCEITFFIQGVKHKFWCDADLRTLLKEAFGNLVS